MMIKKINMINQRKKYNSFMIPANNVQLWTLNEPRSNPVIFSEKEKNLVKLLKNSIMVNWAHYTTLQCTLGNSESAVYKVYIYYVCLYYKHIYLCIKIYNA